MKEIQINQEGFVENFKLDYVAKQSSGSVLYQKDNTVILASVAIGNKDIEEDFTPFSVQYIEKAYAVGKFPAGFIKREGKLSEFEILTSRIIDRTLRPLFPKNYQRPTHLSVFVLSHDGKSDLQVCALNAASAALFVSEAPFSIPVAGVRIGMIQNDFILNPAPSELSASKIDLFISGSRGDILMIEMKGKSTDGVNEEKLLEAIEFAKQKINTISLEYEKCFLPHKKESLILVKEDKKSSEDLERLLAQDYRDRIKEIINQMSKTERNTELNHLGDELIEKYQDYDSETILCALQNLKRQLIRQQILNEHIRADGRKLTEVRPIEIQTNILPCAHGSVLFTRGQTQALVVSTLGSDNDAQSKEILGCGTQKDHFTFHYNFPGFSVGEPSMIGSVGRRELGHGNLARKALEDSIIDKTQTIRLVSEILESNGSSSMASVCGGSLALAASGIKTTGLIAGIAMGLIAEDSKYAILTDIMGLEDHDGDMDFKIAGNFENITAMQMDIKLGGINATILKDALYQAKEARIHILEIMQKAVENLVVNEKILPKTEEFEVPVSKIVEIIGAGGKTIKEIIDRFNVSIDLDREKGGVKIFGTDTSLVAQAKDFILELIGEKNAYEIGESFEGVVRKVMDFGVFVSLPKGGDGLLHASKITKNRFEKPYQYFQEGQKVKCVIIGFNKGKIDLDIMR